ncbi:MAG: NADH-quinone oxidoreductase subunit NuoE [Spirochaetes bacterium]|nr:NADH-quinone oxidoreductase subunit NuoE [Spirochaetota bacterium]
MGNCCNNADNSALQTEAEEIIAFTGKEKTISILQEVQKRKGYLPEALLCEIARLTGIAISDFYGVATFYSQFSFTPLGKYVVKLCNGTACFVSGADLLYETLCDFLKIKNNETTPDGLFTIETVACIGCCSLAPVVMIGDRLYGKQTPSGIRDLLQEIVTLESAGNSDGGKV